MNHTLEYLGDSLAIPLWTIDDASVRELAVALKKAQAARVAESNFLANMSHENARP